MLAYKKISVPDEACVGYDEWNYHPILAAAHEYEPWRGPHEGREYKLFAKHGKPMALINVPDLQHWDASPLSDELFFTDHWYDGYFIVDASQYSRINMVFRMHDMYHAGKISLDTYSARFGILLGYSKKQIRAFIGDRDEQVGSVGDSDFRRVLRARGLLRGIHPRAARIQAEARAGSVQVPD
jgi:hypothetical protein